jgi:hypothetical protein
MLRGRVSPSCYGEAFCTGRPQGPAAGNGRKATRRASRLGGPPCRCGSLRSWWLRWWSWLLASWRSRAWSAYRTRPRPLRESPRRWPAGETMAPESTEAPAGHPPIGTATSPHGSVPSASDEAPAIASKMPATLQPSPSPNAMRLAAYRTPAGVEVSVSRAGRRNRSEHPALDLSVRRHRSRGARGEDGAGIHVVTVDVTGTYVGGGMSMGGPTETKHDWAMLAPSSRATTRRTSSR